MQVVSNSQKRLWNIYELVYVSDLMIVVISGSHYEIYAKGFINIIYGGY